MSSRRSLSNGGALSVRKRGSDAQDSPASDMEDSASEGTESDGSLRKSVGIFHTSPDPSPAALPPTNPPNGLRQKKGREVPPAGTPQTVPRAQNTMSRRQLADVLANQRLLLQRMTKLESMVEDLKTKKRHAKGKQKVEVSNDIRSMVRQGYDHAINTDGKDKWNVTQGMKATSAVNNDTSQAVLEYVKGLLPGYEDKIAIVKAAVNTYFISKKREEKRAADGKTEMHKKQCTRNTRKMQKLNQRLKALRAKRSYNKTEKEKIQRVLLTEYMSSDESEDDNGERIFRTRFIPWESKDFKNYKSELDMKHKSLQSEQAKKQSVKRIPGLPASNKKKPQLPEQDAWIAQ